MLLSELIHQEIQDKFNGNKTAFAKAAGLQTTQISRLLELKPGKRPSPAVLEKITGVLGISQEEILELCKSKPPAPVVQASGLQCGRCYDVIRLSKELNRTNPAQEILTPRAIAEEFCRQDASRCNLASRFAGDANQWASIFENFPDSSRVFYLINNGQIEIVGDWSIVFYDCGSVPIDEEEGVVAEEEIRLEKLSSMVSMGDCDLVILNLGLTNEWNIPEYQEAILTSFEGRMSELMQAGLNIHTVYANVYRRDIAEFSSLGFKKYNEKFSPRTDAAGKSIPVLYQFDNSNNTGSFRFLRRGKA